MQPNGQWTEVPSLPTPFFSRHTLLTWLLEKRVFDDGSYRPVPLFRQFCPPFAFDEQFKATYICTHACTNERTCEHTHACMHACMAHIHSRACTQAQVCFQTPMQICPCTYTSECPAFIAWACPSSTGRLYGLTIGVHTTRALHRHTSSGCRCPSPYRLPIISPW